MNRKLSVILGILILLAVIHHFIKNSSSGIKPFANIKAARVIEVENMASKDKFCLIKSPAGWEIITSTNYPADSRRAESLANEIKNLKFETVISFSENKRFEHELSSAAAVKVSAGAFFAGKKMVSVLVGKRAFDRNHFYAGFENDKKSYLAGGLRRELLLSPAEYYRNRRISKVAEEDAAVLKIKSGKKIYEVSRSTSGWNFQGPAMDDFYKAMSYCLNMGASDFYDTNFVPAYTIEITKKDGATVTWEFGEAEKNKFCARVPSSNGGYMISTEKAAAIIKFFQKHASK
ncbi:DUF4340 domain-containing protein [bacterium]|nr:DUF4340 domain-containing protein [bacterium]MBU3955919.1 DUF4340 domain-containing protein [bacterium]MBU4134419.1 DUF4340 domain-containing protein [bacterium]